MNDRLATRADAAAIARIYNEGIADRMATFETRPRTPEDIVAWFDGVHPIVVVEREGDIVAFAGTYRRHARLDGTWRDVVIVERLIGAAADGRRVAPGRARIAENPVVPA